MLVDAAAETLPEGTLLDGKFRIVRCVGIGGMGSVYEIRHELTKHRRALKLLHRQLATDREAVERFLREASAAGRIDNPHITETFDAGWLASGDPYLVMEYLEGEALDERLASGGLPLDEALLLVAQTCRALHAAHGAGIVHRDLKPENLFIVIRDERPFVKVLDFGIGKFEDARAVSRATMEGAFMGTPYYMSPEQFLDGKKVDARSDVYSLGVILYECVTGQHPYPCDTLARLATKIMVEEPAAPSSLRSGLPSGVDAVLARALAKRADDRYPTAEAMAVELERLCDRNLLTLPQGSSWQSQFPPSVDVRAARRVADKTVRVVEEEETMQSAGQEEPVEAAPPRSEEVTIEAPAPRWRLGLLVGAGAAAVVLAVVAVSLSSKTEETTSPSATPVSTEAAPSTALTAGPTAGSTAGPTASASASVQRPTPAPRSSKPDYATEDEFPD